MLAESHVEVWWRMIVIVHCYDDTEESTDLGHQYNVAHRVVSVSPKRRSAAHFIARRTPGRVVSSPLCVLGEAERRLRGILHGGRMELHEMRVDLPPPDLEPHPITMEQYHAYAPEKFELWEGYLFLPAEYPELRQQLLKLLLVNMGLREAVRMAPKAAWREALERVYGEE